MKCKACNGLGRIKATELVGVDEGLREVVILCPTCGGKGEYEPFDADVELDKLYPTEQTNEEWMRSCTTEQLVNAIFDCTMANSWNFSKNGIKRWLKQPHKEEHKNA